MAAPSDMPPDGSRRTRNDVRLAAAAVGMALLLLAIGIEHYWLRDLKFDDAWIHFRYARNLAQGKGFVYNDGERVLGSGGIAWNLILALLARATGPDTLSSGVSIMNFAALVGCTAILYRALRVLVPPWVGLTITGFLLAQGPLLVCSIGGMETTLLCLLYFATFLALLHERYVLAALAAGAAVCFRVESIALLGATLLAGLLYRRRSIGAILVAGAVLPALASLWAWAYFGSPLANSTLAKKIVYVVPPLAALGNCVDFLLAVFPFDRLVPLPQHPALAHWVGTVTWMALIELGYFFLRKRSPPASLIVLQVPGALAFYGVTNPQVFRWYTCTFIPLATLLAMLGMLAIVQTVPGLRTRPWGSFVVLLAVISFMPLRLTWWPFVPPDDVRFSIWLPNAREHARTYQYVRIARWLNERSKPTDRVCISEIGAFGYHYRGPILDALGLVSPEVLPYHPLPEALRPNGLIGAIPPRVVRDFLPEFVVSLDVFAGAVFADPWFNEHYRLIGRWPWFGGPVPWRDLPSNILGGREMRAYRRLDVPWAPG
jgi:hypothetical protein